jgi:hypothetical protein
MGTSLSGTSLSGGISGTFRGGSSWGTGGIISGSCFFGSSAMTAPFDSLAEETRRQSKRSSKIQALIPQALGKRTVAE